MVTWIVSLSDEKVFHEDTIVEELSNPDNVTPWLLLLSYCEEHNVSIKVLNLWDSNRGVRIASPFVLPTIKPDDIDCRKKIINDGLGKSKTMLLYGIVVIKNSIKFGVWYNEVNSEVITTIEE